MIDGQWRRAGLATGHREQRNVTAAGRLQVDVFQSRRALPILWSYFQHHVILVHLRIDDGDFRLAERVV